MAVVLLLGYWVTYYIMCMAPQENRTRTLEVVRIVCDDAFDNQNAATWSVCYKVQERANAEYNCPGTAVASSQCQIEDKEER